jgi:hypothetical protein
MSGGGGRAGCVRSCPLRPPAAARAHRPAHPAPAPPCRPCRRLLHAFPWDPTGAAHLALALQRRSGWLPSLRATVAPSCGVGPHVTDWGCRPLPAAPEAVAARRQVGCCIAPRLLRALAGWLGAWLAGWVPGWLAAWLLLAGWLAAWLAGWLAVLLLRVACVLLRSMCRGVCQLPCRRRARLSAAL